MCQSIVMSGVGIIALSSEKSIVCIVTILKESYWHISLQPLCWSEEFGMFAMNCFSPTRTYMYVQVVNVFQIKC